MIPSISYKIIVIHRLVDTDSIYMPRFSIGRNLQQPEEYRGLQEIIIMLSDSDSHRKRLLVLL